MSAPALGSAPAPSHADRPASVRNVAIIAHVDHG
jgi:hypothetical protein